MRERNALVTLILLCLVSGCAAPAHTSPDFDPTTLTRVVVKVEEGGGQYRVDPSIMRQVEEVFTGQLLAKHYAVAARHQLDRGALEQERDFQRSGHVDETEEAIVARGKMIAVPAVLVVTASSFGATTERVPYQRVGYVARPKVKHQPQQWDTVRTSGVEVIHTARGMVSARLIDATTGQLLWSSSQSVTGRVGDPRQAAAILPGAAGQIARAFPGRTPKDLAKREKRLAKQRQSVARG